MDDRTQITISNHIGNANDFIQRAREELEKAHALTRGNQRVRLECTSKVLGWSMGALSEELDQLEPDGCPF